MTNKPTVTSGGSIADVMPAEKITIANAADMSAVQQAKNAILNHLCKEFRRTGVNAPVEWRPLQQQLGLAEAAFGTALNDFIKAGAVEVERVGRDHIQLGPKGRTDCENR